MTVADIASKRAKQAPHTDTLWEAFALAQEKFGPIMKDTKGARGKYAPLDAVLEMARPILNECGLVLTQPPYIEGDTLMVRTAVVHKATGEMHECSYPAGLLTLQHQQLGAGVTYARRYSLLSILGVFPENEDDDGEKAGAAGGERHPPSDPQPRQQQTSPPDGVRPQARRFVDKACAELLAGAGDLDAVYSVFDDIQHRPGWVHLSSAEKQIVIAAKKKALPDDPS